MNKTITTNNQTLNYYVDSYFDNIFLVQSILKSIQKNCLEMEFSSIYYNLPVQQQKLLSEERNDNINMLGLALEKIASINKLNYEFEDYVNSVDSV